MTVNVYDILDSNGIEYRKYEHEAVFTVEDANRLYDDIAGAHTKNLFLRNKDKSQYYLFIIASHKRADLEAVARQIGETKLSFANSEELLTYLGVTPGSVSALALINDTSHAVGVLIDREVWSADAVNAHPNINTATLTFAQNDFHAFFEILRYTPIVVRAE